MKKQFSVISLVITAVAAMALTLSLVAGGLYLYLGPMGFGVAQAMVLINSSFVGEHDMGKAADAAMDALITNLGDRWSYYLDAQRYQQQQENKANAYVGIGASVTYPEGEEGFYVVSVVKDGPADQGGLCAGDTVLRIDDTALTGEDRLKGAELAHGPAGTTLRMEVRGVDGTLRTLNVVRNRVEEPPVSYQLLEDGTGLVTIKNFNSRCAAEGIKAVDDLVAQGAERLVFDVRNNGGGYLQELTDLLDHLLPEGVIFRSETKSGQTSEVRSDAKCVALPMAVLVNENSYSAAELFAAELREQDWAVVAGSATTGKGFSQQTFPLIYGGAINISTAKYFTGNGVSLIGTGLIPDPALALTDEQSVALQQGALDPAQDPQLQGAIAAIMD